MPAVTVTSTKYNVNGSMRDQYYTITGNSGDFLVVGLNNINLADVQVGSPITGVAMAAGPFPGSTQITFTSSGAFTASKLELLGT
jgi:hypothetical protein